MTAPKRKSASAQAEERLIAAEIAKADHFTAYLRCGPHEKYIEQAPSYEDAKAKLAALVAQHSKFGRGGIVYAVTKLGRFDCTDELVALARSL